jgi:serine/threonine protein kinase
VEILQDLLHPSICRLQDAYVTPSFAYLVFDLEEGVELFEVVRGSRGKGLSEDHARELVMRLLSPVLYLHTLGIAHRDLKLENIITSPSGHLVLIDFGHSARLSSPRLSSKASPSTLEYTAPEILVFGEGGLPADVWALGIILYALLYASLPFDGPEEEVRQLIVRGHVVFPEIREVSAAGRDLILHMLHPDPNERLSVREIKEHPWFMHHLPSHYPSFLPSPLSASSHSLESL